jgi:hypothetical protein
VFVAERMAVVAIWMTLQVRKFTLLGWFVFHERMKFRTQAGKMDRMLTPQEWGARSLFLMRTVGWIQNHFFWIRGFHLCEGAVALFYRIETDYFPRSIKISLECSLKKQGEKCHCWDANISNLDPFLQVGKRSSKNIMCGLRLWFWCERNLSLKLSSWSCGKLHRMFDAFDDAGFGTWNGVSSSSYKRWMHKHTSCKAIGSCRWKCRS